VALDSLEDLRTFALVVNLGGLSAAARKLQVTTNAVSRRIQRLERQVGARLLHRTTRRLSATDEGRTLYARCERILREVEEAETELVASRSELAGTVRLAVPAGGVESDLLVRLREALNAHPGLAVQLHVTHGRVDVVESGIDIAVVLGEPSPPSVVARRLGTVAWRLAATPDYLARCGRPRVPNDLTKHRCLRLLSDRPQLEWRLVDVQGREVVVEVGGSFECDDSGALGDATYAGLGIGVRPDHELTRAIEDGRLEAVLPGYRFGNFPRYAILPPGRLRVPRVAAVLELLREAYS
jgi:DNA-binding transcriptional LysR family regulator